MDNTQYYPIIFDEQGDSFVVVNNGTAPAPCILTIIPKVDFLKLVVEGLTETPITFTGLKANQALVIDGESREVSVDGVSAFAFYDAWEFPRLLPGTNQIKIKNGTSASISIEYSANYI
jgi:phage-related protein